jgi:2-amino-4-hydroxy-6-hydroxymethyldihydropteridine diphosphokinase
LTVKYDLAECICSDEIGSAVDYSAVAAEAVAFAKKTQFRLLEKLADALCRHLLIAFPRALTIWLRLQKSRTAIGEAGTSFYCSICRRRALAIVRLRSDSCRTLDEASRRLMAVPHCRFLRSSSTYRTAQLHLTERQEFFSRSLLIVTPLSSAELLREMDAVGPVLGCLRSGCGRSNPVDMDLLLFEGIDFSSLAIAVPGWRLRSRRFPVEELADLGLAPMVEMENASISRQWCEKVKDLPDSNR